MRGTRDSRVSCRRPRLLTTRRTLRYAGLVASRCRSSQDALWAKKGSLLRNLISLLFRVILQQSRPLKDSTPPCPILVVMLASQLGYRPPGSVLQPSGVIATRFTPYLCPRRTAVSRRLSVSQIRTQSSLEPLTTHPPSVWRHCYAIHPRRVVGEDSDIASSVTIDARVMALIDTGIIRRRCLLFILLSPAHPAERGRR